MTNYRRRRTPPKEKGPNFNINKDIKAPEMRILNEEGEMLGVFSRKEAFIMAQEKELDLIEINPKAQPPVVRLVDYNKFKFQYVKSQAAKAKKVDDTKQIRVSVRISIHDLKVQVKKINTFLEKGLKVKLQVLMRGRERQHPEVAEETMHTLLGLIEEPYMYENEPKLAGASIYSTIKPKKQ